MSGVLVLNASYEALCVVPTRRAVSLMVVGKAELLESTGALWHSARLAFEEPSVIRLRAYVKVPAIRRIAPTRRAIFARDQYRCQYCGAPAENIDHIVPRSRGGQHTWDNVVASCRSCNARKRDSLLSETSFRLRSVPRTPRGRTSAIRLFGMVREEWAPYLEDPSDRLVLEAHS